MSSYNSLFSGTCRNILQPDRDSIHRKRGYSQSQSLFSSKENKDVADPEQEWAVLNKYLQDSNLLEVLNSWVLLIANLDALPYNPYTTLAWYARRHAERFHMFFEEEDAIFQKLDCTAYNVGDHITRTLDEPARWGLCPILKAVNAKALQKFDWVVTTIPLDVSRYDTRDTNTKYVVHKSLPVLVGPCVFYGSLYPDIPLVQVRIEYAITGPRIDHAVEMFAEWVLSDIKRFEEKDIHILLDVLVPEQVDYGWSHLMWTYQTIINNQEKFLILVQAATKSQKLIFSECLFRVDPSKRYYKRGKIAYNLNFISEEPQRTIWKSPLPYLSAYQGVFASHSSLVHYLSWFENVEKADKTPDFRQQTRSTTKESSLFSSRTKKTSNKNFSSSNTISNTATCAALFESGTTDTWIHPGRGPYGDNGKERFRKYLRENMSICSVHEDFFIILHDVILLLLLDRDKEEEEAGKGLVEAYRLLHGTLYKIYLVIEENSFLQSLLLRFTKKESADSHVVQLLYLEYRQHLKELLCHDLKERSIEFTVAGQVLFDRLNVIAVKPNTRVSCLEEPGILPLSTQVIDELQVINRYCWTLLFGLLDDTLSFCPTLKHYLRSIDQSGHSFTKFQHGVEEYSILNQDKTCK